MKKKDGAWKLRTYLKRLTYAFTPIHGKVSIRKIEKNIVSFVSFKDMA